jgi:hypothetical protein
MVDRFGRYTLHFSMSCPCHSTGACMHCRAGGIQLREEDRGLAPACLSFFAPALMTEASQITQGLHGFAETQKPPPVHLHLALPLASAMHAQELGLPHSWALSEQAPSILGPSSSSTWYQVSELSHPLWPRVLERAQLLLSLTRGTWPRGLTACTDPS